MLPAAILGKAGDTLDRRLGDDDEIVRLHEVRDHAVELIKEQARIVGGLHLGVFDGGFALASVVRPLVRPEDDSPRIEILTRLRQDARLRARRRGAPVLGARAGSTC